MTKLATQAIATLDSSHDPKGYYGLPVIHRPHWKWLIICYFFLGGISGSSAIVAAFSRLFDREDGVRVARIATYVSTAALLPCPLLLVLDLGRPARFLNMLRVFRPSSPMSMGSWGLAAFSALSMVATTLQILADTRGPTYGSHQRLDALMRPVAAASALFGFFVAGYTGVLLAATAVPLWSKRPWILAPLLLSSAIATGTAAVSLAFSLAEPNAPGGEEKLRRFEAFTALTESVLLASWLLALGSTSRPISEGRLGIVMRYVVAGAGMVLPQLLNACLTLIPGRKTRLLLTRLSSVSALIGGFGLRYAVVQGGRDSADDPQATFEMTG